MPMINVKVAAGQPPERKRAILSGIRAALLEAFSLPESDCFALLEEYPAEHMAFPVDLEAVLVSVQCFSGRTPEQKAEFYRLAAQAVDKVGLNGGDMVAVIHEAPLCDWGICGGRSAAVVFGKNKTIRPGGTT